MILPKIKGMFDNGFRELLFKTIIIIIIKNKVFLKNIFKLFSLVFWGLFWKIIIQTCRIIKNKVLDIKIILKTYLKILKIG